MPTLRHFAMSFPSTFFVHDFWCMTTRTLEQSCIAALLINRMKDRAVGMWTAVPTMDSLAGQEVGRGLRENKHNQSMGRARQISVQLRHPNKLMNMFSPLAKIKNKRPPRPPFFGSSLIPLPYMPQSTHRSALDCFIALGLVPSKLLQVRQRC